MKRIFLMIVALVAMSSGGAAQYYTDDGSSDNLVIPEWPVVLVDNVENDVSWLVPEYEKCVIIPEGDKIRIKVTVEIGTISFEVKNVEGKFLLLLLRDDSISSFEKHKSLFVRIYKELTEPSDNSMILPKGKNLIVPYKSFYNNHLRKKTDSYDNREYDGAGEMPAGIADIDGGEVEKPRKGRSWLESVLDVLFLYAVYVVLKKIWRFFGGGKSDDDKESRKLAQYYREQQREREKEEKRQRKMKEEEEEEERRREKERRKRRQRDEERQRREHEERLWDEWKKDH